MAESLVPPQPARYGLIQSLIASLLKHRGDVAGARTAYSRSERDTRPDDLNVRFNYGSLLAAKGSGKEDAIEAAAQFGAVLRRNPDHVDALISLGSLQLEFGNIRDAQMNLDQASA